MVPAADGKSPIGQRVRQHDAEERNSVMGILPNAAFTPDAGALIRRRVVCEPRAVVLDAHPQGLQL